MNARASIRTAADFGYRVREERERQGITQAALAASADVSIRWLSNFERGKSPRAELIKVVHVARALGLVFALNEETRPPLSETQQRLLDSVRSRLPSATASPTIPSAMQAMLESIGRSATEAQPTAQQEAGDASGEA